MTEPALSDLEWFSEHQRFYRIRQSAPGAWVIISRLPPGLKDDDDHLRVVWVHGAWSCLDQAQREKLVKQIKRAESVS